MLLDRVDRDDAGMVDRGDGLRLALEALPRVWVAGENSRKDLQRDAPMQPRVFGDEDLAHPALAERFEDAIVADGFARVHVHDSRRRSGGQIWFGTLLVSWSPDLLRKDKR